MASVTLRRPSWFLQISRSSRIFSLNFSTTLCGAGRRRRLPSPPPFPLSSRSPYSPSCNKHWWHESYAATRRSFVSTHGKRQQQTQSIPNASNTPDSPPIDATQGMKPTTEDFSQGLNDKTPDMEEDPAKVDWTRSYQGLSREAFSPEAAKILQAPIDLDDIEVKSDGIIYLPEIKYRRILNQAFGPGGWGLAPRGETIVTPKAVTREYALVVLGRLVSIARGEQDYFNPDSIPTAVEGCKSTALRRCCKDLGIASELWDPRFIRKFMHDHVQEIFVEHVTTKKRRKIYLRKGDKVQYPWKEAR